MKQIIYALLAVVLLISGGCEDSNRELQLSQPSIALGMTLKIHVPKDSTAKLKTTMIGNNRKAVMIGGVLFHEYCRMKTGRDSLTILQGGSGASGTDYEISHVFYNDSACGASVTISTKNYSDSATDIGTGLANAIVTYDAGSGDTIRVTIEMKNMTVLTVTEK